MRIARQIGEVVIITRDANVRRLAKQAGVWALVESGTDLNAALRQASEWVSVRGAAASLILPSDLPLLNFASLNEIIRAGRHTPSIVISPCRRFDGTNALLLRPPGLIDFSYGPGSFEKHRQAAQAVGIEPVIYQSATIALDLDVPDDLKESDMLPLRRNERTNICFGDG